MIVTIANQKGGVCKTSTALSLASGLAARGYKILLVDTDPQGSLSFAAHTEPGPMITSVIAGKTSALEAIQKTPEGVYIIPSDETVTDFLKSKDQDLLKNALDPVRKYFHVIIIDTPPTLSGITQNAIKAADRIIIPATPSVMALQGIRQLYRQITKINKTVKISGILLTR